MENIESEPRNNTIIPQCLQNPTELLTPMNEYFGIYPVTKEDLDKIKIGDYVKINNWSRGMKVRQVSDNYILCASRSFDGQFRYAVISKTPIEFTKNDITEKHYYYGKDNTISDGYHIFYNFDDDNICREYIRKFDAGELKISHKVREPIYRLSLKVEDAKAH